LWVAGRGGGVVVYGFSASSLRATTRRTWPDSLAGGDVDSSAVAVAPGDVRALRGLLAGELVRVFVYAADEDENVPRSVIDFAEDGGRLPAWRLSWSVGVTVEQHGLRRR
jgi:hypothetical protein